MFGGFQKALDELAALFLFGTRCGNFFFCYHKQIRRWQERAQTLHIGWNKFDSFLSFTHSWCGKAVSGMQVSLTARYGYTVSMFCQRQQENLRNFDIKFRNLLRTIVGPPGGLKSCALWHDVFCTWNARVWNCTEQASVKLWSLRCLEQHWKSANYIATWNVPYCGRKDETGKLQEQETHGTRKYKCTADANVWGNGAGRPWWHVYGWRM